MTALPFSAVVGQEAAKRGLLLVAVQPMLGGVLLRGDKGSAKTTLARGLAALLPGNAPFVELPLGATEERVIGSLDLADLLTKGQPSFRPGLLAAADGGVLYVDEINLLADHLVDALLDVAVTGVNRVERDGLSHTHPARFVLVASMNPEEGELRPQLLDRFGLAVDVSAPLDAGQRARAVRRQLAAEAAGGSVERELIAEDDAIRDQLDRAQQARIDLPEDVIAVATRLALAVGAEGLRADLMLCRAAAALAALEGRSAATVDDVRTVAEMVLADRRRRRPFDEPGFADEELDQAWGEATAPPIDDDDGPRPSPGGEQLDAPLAPATLRLPSLPRAAGPTQAPGGFGTTTAPRGRLVRDEPYDTDVGGPIDARATAVAVASRRARTAAPSASVSTGDLRGAVREQRSGSLVVLVVDASASMGVEHRMAATKAAVLGLLGDAYRRRGKVALVTFHGDDAEVVVRPTGSIEIARARLVDLRTGGTTPLAVGVREARSVVERARAGPPIDCTVVLVTDGRATSGGPDPVASSIDAMAELCRTGARVVVLDTEPPYARLGLARQLAEAVGVECLELDLAQPDELERMVRSL